MIILTRRRLVDAARAWRDGGKVPPLVDDPETAGAARSGEFVAAESQDWLDAYDEALARVRHPLPALAAE